MTKALAGASKIRNRVIAKVFYQLKWIEQLGTGIQRIVKECQSAELATPIFEELNNQFRVTLYSTKLLPKLLAKSKKTATPKLSNTKPSNVEKWQKDLLSYLKQKEQVSTSEAAVLWQITSRAARLRLIKLIDAGLIRKTGTSLRDPFSYYVLKN